MYIYRYLSSRGTENDGYDAQESFISCYFWLYFSRLELSLPCYTVHPVTIATDLTTYTFSNSLIIHEPKTKEINF